MNSRRLIPVLVILLAAGCLAPAVQAVNIEDTRLLGEPAVSENHVAFIYAGDLWVADKDGGQARRVTSHSGQESSPFFSPDGGLIAFSGEYDGNTDVFVVPATGGEPKRLSWHPGRDRVCGWTPDGTQVLFASSRAAAVSYRHEQLFTVNVEHGRINQLPIPNAHKACYSPAGDFMAYTPNAERFGQWKNYRGGTISRIWIIDLADYAVREISKPKGGCNDTDPMWIGGAVYFRSDRNGEFNLFSYDLDTAEVRQLTQHEDFSVIAAGGSQSGGCIAYEQAGYLHLYTVVSGQTQRLQISVAADLIETRPRFASDDDFIRAAAISPAGARAVFGYRGEIVTVPAEKGHPRNLTKTVAVHEHDPAWSPDGQWIAYFSDEGGEYALHVAPQDGKGPDGKGPDGKGEVRRFEMGGSGFYDTPVWSPDSEKICYTDNSWSLYWIDINEGQPHKIAQEALYGPMKMLHHAWSPDSRWIVYTLYTINYFQQVHLYSLADDESTALTDGLSDVAEPVFDAGGKYLYFFGSTDAGPVRSWFAMSNADMEMTSHLYLAVLPADEPSPMVAESDEAVVTSDEDDEGDE
ncbi:MAG: peptidase S41, partial [bacterium]